MQLQQGDVNIQKIDSLPSGIKKRDSMVVAEGEATGHSHRLQGNVQVFEEGSLIFADVPEGSSVSLVHEEHGTVDLEPGIYKFHLTHEVDHFKEEARMVID